MIVPSWRRPRYERQGGNRDEKNNLDLRCRAGGGRGGTRDIPGPGRRPGTAAIAGHPGTRRNREGVGPIQ
ncbi:hypothetical protein DESC_600076 [Desulfosarcina cetonica]|nr:hypothetical protein DESC_600076 [Desulfosarcina cetonica]